MPSTIIAATGHRPDKLQRANYPTYSTEAHRELTWFAQGWLEVQLGSTTDKSERPDAVISSMAIGWDLAVAQAALNCCIPLIAAIPFPAQASRWPSNLVYLWRQILDRANTVHTISKSYTPGAFQRRNEWMVDNAYSLVALWNGTSGGTANCLKYARLHNKPVTNLWPKYNTKEWPPCP